jgi:hypothetical protein
MGLTMVAGAKSGLSKRGSIWRSSDSETAFGCGAAGDPPVAKSAGAVAFEAHFYLVPIHYHGVREPTAFRSSFGMKVQYVRR